MDLWIRSQDKHLLAKYNMLAVAQVTPKTQAKVMAFVSDDLGYQELGAYNTKERALEVLDEIQKFLISDFIKFVNIDVDKDIVDYLNAKAILINDPDCKQKVSFEHRDCIVFEMPEK